MTMKIADYRKHAEECRRLAKGAGLPHIRDELLKMAGAWDKLAEGREEHLARKEKLSKVGGAEG